MDEESESSLDLDASEESVPPDKDRGRSVVRKRRKSMDNGVPIDLSDSDAEYDQEEAAMQHALALSLANTPAAGKLLQKPLF